MRQTNLLLLLTATITAIITASIGASFDLALAAAPPAKKKQTRAAYRSDLDRVLSENNVPCKVALDCEAVALGSKPCGGPTEYVLMTQSTRMKAQAAVSDLTKIITEMDQTANGEGGVMGTCEAVEKPELACKSGTCVAVSKSTESKK